MNRRVLVLVAALAGGGGAPATARLTDGDGTLVSEVVERWAFDPAFGAEVCHIDTEGRVRVAAVDSNGQDPRTGAPAGTGLPTEVRSLAATVASGSLTSASACRDLAPGARSASDVVVTRSYCGVAGTACAATFLPGDLVATSQGRRVERIERYDAFGNVERSSRPTSGGAAITTTSTYDPRSRRLTQVDTLGHATEWRYDALDRVTYIAGANTKGGSPGDVRTFTYYPGGQLHTEINGLGLTRSITLDGMGRPTLIVESGGRLADELRTEITYDEAGNRRDVTDRRGLLAHTEFDWGDRPISVTVRVADTVRWAAQGGDTADTAVHAVATYGYDAAGNKLFETDRHGFQTSYALDPLYRAVKTTLPQVPGATPTAGGVRYELVRRFDRTGNRTYEVDGNGHATAWAYDAAGRLVRTTDPLGRIETRSYDPEGTVREVASWAPGSGATGTPLRRTISTYDAIGRVLTVTEDALDLDGVRVSYGEITVHDDTAHEVRRRDRRGFVTTRKLDDLDRVYEEIVDDAPASPARQPDAEVGPALSLKSTFGYDENGNRSRVTDPLDRVTSETHDGLNRLLRRDLPMAVSESFKTNGEGQVIETTDRRGVVRRTRFDALGRPTREALVESLHGGAELALVRRTYNDVPVDDRVSVVETDARGYVTWHHRDALGREVQTVYPLGLTVETRFDAVSLRHRVDRNGNITTWSYDAANRPLSQTDSGGGVTLEQTTAYDDEALTATSIDRSGIETVEERDGLGRVRRVTRSGNRVEPSTGVRLVQETETRYDGANNAVRGIDPNGHATAWVYDGAGRKAAETRGHGSPEASTWRYRYDAAGNRTEMKGPRGTWALDLRESFDDLNRPVRSEDALGNVTSRAFDAGGNKLCEKRPLGGDPIGAVGATGMTAAAIEAAVCTGAQVTRYEYDEQSKLARVLDAAGGEHTFVYDEVRNLIAKQDANGNLTTYAYDALNRRTGEHQHLDAHPRLSAYSRGLPTDRGVPDPVAGTGVLQWSFSYDGNGNLRTMTDPRTGPGAVEETVRHEYGVLDRLTRTTWKGFPYPRELPSLTGVAYAYTGNGQLLTATETKETAAGPVSEVTARAYDGLERQESETRYDGKVLAFGYDAKGNRTLVRDPDGVETIYGYDAQDRLLTATTPAGSATYRYWPDGLQKGLSLPNGLDEGRCYDAAGRLVELVSARGTAADDCTTSGQPLTSYEYSFDANGNRLLQTEQRTDPATQVLGAVEETSYGYDELDRLIGVKYPDGTATLYRLDPVGNRTGERKALAARVAALVVAAFAAVQPADAMVDVTGTFNRADWLLSRTDAADASRTVAFAYDLNGNQTSKTRGGATRTLRWDGRNTLVAVYDGGVETGRYDYDRNLQRVKRRTASEDVAYVLDDRYVLQEASASTGASARRYHYGTSALQVTDQGGTTFLSVDALGSTTDQTTTTGTVYQARKYDAWGQYQGGTAPAANQPKLGYTGHQYDPETGLTYARARYYDADAGVFLSRDPIDLGPEGAPYLHRFSYAANNPLLHTDPSGEVLPFLAFIALAGIIGAEVDLIKQEIEKQTTSLSQVVEKVDFKEVAAVGAGSALGAAAFGGALAATGSFAAITGSATAASGTAAGIGLGGTAASGGSAAVAATVSGAVGGYASTTLGALAKGASVEEAHEQGAIAALPSAVAGLAALPLGAVGGTAGAALTSRVAAPQVGRVVGGAMGGFAAGFGADQIVQHALVGGGLQDRVSYGQSFAAGAIAAGIGATSVGTRMPVSPRAVARQADVLSRGVAYNISPEDWFQNYRTIGTSDTYVTDYRAVAQVLGPVRANSRFSVGWFSGKGQVSFLRAWRLERALGLRPGSLREGGGFRFTRVTDIDTRSPRAPLSGNDWFLGPGAGLPGGGPELQIDPIPTSPWP